MLLNISNIQHFSVGDGPGIRTTVFFKGCNLRCPWCHNPENLTASPVVLHYEAQHRTESLGRKVTVEEILPELLEDKDFFAQSGGGITLSGGEVMLQAEGAALLAQALKKNRIPVLIDTAGCVPYPEFEKTNPWVQGYLFDFKTADADRYREIGGCLDTVTQNLMQLLRDEIPLQIRIPLIPDFNSDPASVRQIGEYLQNLGVRDADLLPFHRLGSAKYKALGLPYAYEEYEPFTKEALAGIREIYSEYIQVTVER